MSAARPVLIAFLMTALPAAAGDLQFGPRFSVSDHADLGLGGDVRWQFLRDEPRLALSLSFDHFFPEDPDDELDDFLRTFEELFAEAGDQPFDFTARSELRYWEANLNLTWDIARVRTVTPYAGLGLNYGRAEASVLGFESDSSDFGANVLAGIRFARRFYVEAKREAGGGELFAVSAGVRF